MSDSSTPRVLLLRRRYLADVVGIVGVVQNVLRHWPKAECTIACEPRFAEAVALAPESITTLPWPTTWRDWIRAWRHVRHTGFTHVIDCECSLGSAWLTRRTRAATRLAVPDADVRVTAAYTQVLPAAAPNDSTASPCLRALSVIGIPGAVVEPRLEPRPADVAALARYVGASQRVLLVHPGAKVPVEAWPAERFAALIDAVQDELATQVVLDGGPRDQALLEDIRRHARTHLTPVPGVQTVARFAALARLSHAVFGPASGLMHVAAAVGTPAFALSSAPMPTTPAGRFNLVPAQRNDAGETIALAFAAVREQLLRPRPPSA